MAKPLPTASEERGIPSEWLGIPKAIDVRGAEEGTPQLVSWGPRPCASLQQQQAASPAA